MKITKFNKLFAKTCDDIYALVGEKANYDKSDSDIMLNGATEIISRNFKIDENRIGAFENKIGRITQEYAIGFSKTMGFEGAILSLTFGILEGTGEIGIKGGLKILAESVNGSGITMSKKT